MVDCNTTYLHADPICEEEKPGIVYLPQDALDGIDHINDNTETDPNYTAFLKQYQCLQVVVLPVEPSVPLYSDLVF